VVVHIHERKVRYTLFLTPSSTSRSNPLSQNRPKDSEDTHPAGGSSNMVYSKFGECWNVAGGQYWVWQHQKFQVKTWSSDCEGYRPCDKLIKKAHGSLHVLLLYCSLVGGLILIPSAGFWWPPATRILRWIFLLDFSECGLNSFMHGWDQKIGWNQKPGLEVFLP